MTGTPRKNSQCRPLPPEPPAGPWLLSSPTDSDVVDVVVVDDAVDSTLVLRLEAALGSCRRAVGVIPRWRPLRTLNRILGTREGRFQSPLGMKTMMMWEGSG